MDHEERHQQAVQALKKGDYAACDRIWQELSDEGVGQASVWIGFLLEKGFGRRINFTEAKAWYLKGAQQGDPTGQYRMGVLYQEGNGVPHDMAEAVRWWRQAAEAGLRSAQFMLGKTLFNGESFDDVPEAIEWLKKAAAQDDPEAALNLAYIYEEGNGVEEDLVLAAHFAEIAAMQRESEAQYLLGRLYEDGRGAPQSASSALHWYQKAAVNEEWEVAAQAAARLRRRLDGADTFDFIDALVREGTTLAKAQFLRDDAAVFWVELSDEDESIVNCCERVLQTGSLSSVWIDGVASRPDTGLFIDYKGERHKVPLTLTPDDRHVTLCTLNKALAPDYEIRLCLDTPRGDAWAFLPLPAADWALLESRYGDALVRHFYVMADRPNVFTEDFPHPFAIVDAGGDTR